MKGRVNRRRKIVITSESKALFRQNVSELMRLQKIFMESKDSSERLWLLDHIEDYQNRVKEYLTKIQGNEHRESETNDMQIILSIIQ